jgi:uncharacterized cofD-like protein
MPSKKLKNIVCLGGGNAMPKAVLKELKNYQVKLSVVCAMLDSGGSAGRLRKDYKIVSPGDIRRAFIALSNTSPVVEKLFDYRFRTGELKGHNFANLLIAAMELSTNDYEKSRQELKRILNVSHEVLPATLDKSHLCAVLENGKIVSGETNIDIPKNGNDRFKIKKAFLRPKAEAYPLTLKAIKQADLIVIGPGDLYSSLVQILLVEGISQAIIKSKAKKIYICNLMTKRGETNNFTVADFAQEIEKYLGGEIDFVFYNNCFPDKEKIKKYKRKHQELLSLIKPVPGLSKEKFIGRNLIKKDLPEHNPKKLAKIILKKL